MKFTYIIVAFISAIVLNGCGTGGSGGSGGSNVTDSANTTIATKYAAIVDAGSSGSRIHFYSYQDSNLSSINEICTYGVKPGLSSYTSNPSQAGTSILTLANYLQTCEADNNITTNPKIDFYLLATAGMRLVSQSAAQAIYANVSSSLSTLSNINVKLVETIPGAQEGLYDWLAVNMLENTFNNCQNPTYGAIDVGGASSQISYVVNSPSDATYSQKINSCSYNIFSASFLGLGGDQARYSMNALSGSNSCYPTGYANGNISGAFDYQTCYNLYSNVTSSFGVASSLKQVPSNLNFIGFSSVFYAADFLGVTSNFSSATLTNAINQTCNLSYSQLQTKYQNTSYSSSFTNMCANSTYINDLLYSQSNYNLNNYAVQPKDTINGQGVEWSFGAMVELVSQGSLN